MVKSLGPNVNLNSNMIILKVFIVDILQVLLQYLNSNMIILKVKSLILAISPENRFKFQYDNT